MKNVKVLLSIILTLLLSLNFKMVHALQSKIITIPSGTSFGSYFTAGETLCRIINKETQDKEALRCIARSTGGTLQNVSLVIEDDTTIGIGQSDALARSDQSENLRFVMRLFPEVLTVLASKNSDAKTFSDVARQSKINIGSKLSGDNSMARTLFDLKQWRRDDFSEYSVYEISSLLCANRVDIAFIVSSGTSNIVNEAINNCRAKILPFDKDFIEVITKNDPNLHSYVVPSGTYNEQKEEILTIETDSILFAHEDTSDEVIKRFLNLLFADFEALKNSHNLFSQNTFEDFFKNNTTIKTHQGAQNFLTERSNKSCHD